MLRRSLALMLVPLLSIPVAAQQSIPAPVLPPAPPRISMPDAQTAPRPGTSTSSDDYLTVGRPASTMAPVPAAATIQRPAAEVTVPARTAAPFDLLGRAKVVDGNTLVIRGKTVLLRGADAPEKGQTCLDLVGVPWDCFGRSTARLSALIQGRSVECRSVDPISGTGQCFAGAVDLAEALIVDGLAVSTEGDRTYGIAEASARSSRKGLWSGRFDKPWVVRGE